MRVLEVIQKEIMDVAAGRGVEITADERWQRIRGNAIGKSARLVDPFIPVRLVGPSFFLPGRSGQAEDPVKKGTAPVIQKGVTGRDGVDGVNRDVPAGESDREARGDRWRARLKLNQIRACDGMTAQDGEFTTVLRMGELLIPFGHQVTRSPIGSFLQENHVRRNLVFERAQTVVSVLSAIVGHQCEGATGNRNGPGSRGGWSEIHRPCEENADGENERDCGATMKKECREEDQQRGKEKNRPWQVKGECQGQIAFPDVLEEEPEQDEENRKAVGKNAGGDFEKATDGSPEKAP